MEPMMTIYYLFPNSADNFFVGVPATGAPIPVVGDLVGAKSGGYKVVARVFNYDSAKVLTVDITCQ
jgi:hypothetical protein